jgi:hypothetical protein
VVLHNGNSGLWYFTLKLQKIFNSSQENFEKNKFCAPFPFYFFCVFLVSENLVSKYEQLLILTDIDGFTLDGGPTLQGIYKSFWVIDIFKAYSIRINS